MSKEKTTEEKNDLLGFNWEGDGEDFFGIKEEEETVVIPTKKEETKKEETKEEEEEEPKEEGTKDTFFELEEKETEEINEEEDTKDEKVLHSTETYWEDVYKDFKENGLLNHVELEEGETLTPDRIFELQQEEYEIEVSTRLDNWAKEELDSDAREFIKFKRNGGKTKDFFNVYSQGNSLPEGELGDEDYEDAVIRYQLKSEDWDAEEIEDRLAYLTKEGKKSIVAKKYDKRIQKARDIEKEIMQEEAKASRLAQKEQRQKFRDSIKTALSEVKEVSGYTITKKDVAQLYPFLTKEQYKISDTKSVTGFQKKLSEVFQDTNKMILLAKLINNDFDVSDLKKKTVTEETRKIKSNLEQRRNLRPTKSGSSLEGSSLADLFN